MLNVYLYGCLLVIGSIRFIKAQPLEESYIVKRNISELSEDETADGVTEEKDIFDDYMKIIIFDGLQFRTAVQNKDQLWEDGIVPYVISDDYSEENKDFILKSMEEFHNKTCIQFKEKKNEISYIVLVPGSGCSAVIGKVPTGINTVNLHRNCFVKGIVLHELMHVLGFIHEQNRPDRDKFVKIDFDNIIRDSAQNFKKYTDKELQLFNEAYDYGSVMHYGAFDFAKDRSKPTIIPLKRGVEIGQRKGFSEKDLIKINLLYNCKQNATNVTENTTKNATNITEKTTENATNVTENTTKNATNVTENTTAAPNRIPTLMNQLYQLLQKMRLKFIGIPFIRRLIMN